MAGLEGEYIHENHGELLSRVLIDIEVASGRSFNLKPEQKIAVRNLLAGKDVLAVLPTGFCKSLIYQTFLRARDYQLSGRAALLVISPLKSIIKDQLDDMERLGYPAVMHRLYHLKIFANARIK